MLLFYIFTGFHFSRNLTDCIFHLSQSEYGTLLKVLGSLKLITFFFNWNFFTDDESYLI